MTVGRPREFDVDEALERALEVFWRKGYEGTTLPDLTKAMGINRPSLYAAFGNKESLFRKALERYAKGPGSQIADALAEPTARAVAERWLRATVEVVAQPRNPRGCFVIRSAIACGGESTLVQEALGEHRIAAEKALRARFKRAISDGDLPPDTNVADLTRFVVTLTNGIAVQAASGADRRSLLKVVEMAMRAWPAPPSDQSPEPSTGIPR